MWKFTFLSRLFSKFTRLGPRNVDFACEWRVDDDSCVLVHCENVRFSLVNWKLVVYNRKFRKFSTFYIAMNFTYNMVCCWLKHFAGEVSLLFLPGVFMSIFDGKILKDGINEGVNCCKEEDCTISKYLFK